LPSEQNSAYRYVHVERTFSEFMLSDYGVPGGAPGSGSYAPKAFSTSLDNNFIARCQDCHMPDVPGKASSQSKAVLRPDESIEHPQSGVPAHDMTGGNAWVPTVLASVVPDSPNFDAENLALLGQGSAALTLDLEAGLGLSPASLLAAAGRALSNLERAATIESPAYDRATGSLYFRIVNHTGHKLLSGFPEGRRMWVNVRFFDSQEALVSEINPYDEAAATLKGLSYEYSDPDGTLPAPEPLGVAEVHDDSLVYEMLPASSLTGEAHTFHFVLADGRYKDNRIPPRGFRIGEAAARLVEPAWEGSINPEYFTEEEYLGGYDRVSIDVPKSATKIELRLYYQTTSREYIEFLRDQINGTGNTLQGTGAGGDEPYLVQSDPFFEQLKAWGDTIWRLWRHNRGLPGAAPIQMTETTVEAEASIIVEKQTVPDGAAQVFEFTGDVSGLIVDGQQLVAAGLWPGRYEVTESGTSGWSLDSIVCSDDDSHGDTGTATAIFTLGHEEIVTCVFTNVETCGPIVLSNEVISTTEAYHGCPSVTIGPSLLISDSADVEVTATEWISISPEFRIGLGARFSAEIGDGMP
jgi:hypothetical protein